MLLKWKLTKILMMIILDNETMYYILFMLGIRTEIDINYYKGEVSINRLD